MQFDIPLAERMRPKSLNEYFGQEHLTGENGIITRALNSGSIPSMIFWGPPGVGKTTLAEIIAKQSNRPFFQLSAINAGVKDIREIIEKAGKNDLFKIGKPILFIDEIHRFSKSQQDSLLGAVERGTITLIGATTENPSFEVINALISRCQVYILNALDKDDLINMVNNALKFDEILKLKNVEVKEYEALLHLSGGDGRKLLNLLEIIVMNVNSSLIEITNVLVMDLVKTKMAAYDKSGEQHYDIISAFIKSMRGSDPNAAVYWLARMLEGGEDPKFIARRMIILASEDIGNANPNALLLATNCFQAIDVIGMPEARIILSQTAIYLATSPKSNASYVAINQAMELVKNTGDLPVPIHLRNAPTKLMKEIGYGANYQYAHDFTNNFVDQEFLPEKLSSTKIYDPGNNAKENEIRQKLKFFWKTKYDY